MPAGRALRLLLPSELGLKTGPGYVLVCVHKKAMRDLPVAVYPIGDLVLPPKPPWMYRYRVPFSKLCEIVTRFVNDMPDRDVAAWAYERGPARIDCAGGALIITQTERGHEQVDRLLRQWRTAIALAAALPAKPRAAVPRVAFPEPPGSAAMQEALEARIDVDLTGVSLAEAIATVADTKPRVNFVLRRGWNWVGTATLKRQATPRRAVLEALLPPGELDCEIRDGYVFISRRWGMQPELSVVAYPIADLVRRHSEVSDILDMVTDRVNDDRDPDVAPWGPAQMECAGGVLLISQTPPAHRRINALLQELRSRRRGPAGPP
jgi:hypothetical protein